MENQKKVLVIPTGILPTMLREVLRVTHPNTTGLAVEETHSGQSVNPVGEQIKHDGLLIAGYLHREKSEMLFRIVDTSDNWKTRWYKVVHAVTITLHNPA